MSDLIGNPEDRFPCNVAIKLSENIGLLWYLSFITFNLQARAAGSDSEDESEESDSSVEVCQNVLKNQHHLNSDHLKSFNDDDHPVYVR